MNAFLSAGRRIGQHAFDLVNRSSTRTGLVVALLSSTMVIAAVVSDGAVATNVQLDDASVWVTNESTQRVGRLNVQTNQLDFAIATAGSGDVIQDGRQVYFSSSVGGVQSLDVKTGSPRGDNEIDISKYQINGGVAVVFDDDSGGLWFGPDTRLLAVDFPENPQAVIEPGSYVVVTTALPDRLTSNGDERGAVLVVSRAGWYELELTDSLSPVYAESAKSTEEESTSTTETLPDPPESEESSDLPPVLKSPDLQPLNVIFDDITYVTAVGSTPVLAMADGSVVVPSMDPIAIPGEQLILQQAGRDHATVAVASTDGLFEIDLGSGEVARLGTGGGAPAAPVRLGACVYGAWSGAAPTRSKVCESESDSRYNQPLPQSEPDARLVYRVNRSSIALNSPGDGGIWADHAGEIAYAGNWSDVDPNSEDAQELNEAIGQSRQTIERTCLEGGANPPTTGDDNLGVRPRQSIIDVLHNDDDPNCEPIAIVSLSPLSGPWGQLTIIDDGQHLLFSPSEKMGADAEAQVQSFQFTYVVQDTSGNESGQATVSVSVAGRGVRNLAPALRPKRDDTTREMKTVVEEGHSVGYDVLADWWDPDGDDLRLVEVVALGGGEVSSTPDGLVRYSANGVSPGVQRVQVTMSDGRLTTVEELEVTIKPTGSSIPPVTANDFVTIVEGATAIVYPLSNDSDPNETKLELVPLWPQNLEGAYLTSLHGGAVEIVGIGAGTYALDYEASDGTDRTKGTIRLVINVPPEGNSAPIAVPDRVNVRSDRVVNVDVLENDIDADGDLLAVTGVSVSAHDPSLGEVRASIVDRRLVQIEVVPGPGGEVPTGPFDVSYTLEDGQSSFRGASQSPEENAADALRASGAVSVLVQPASTDQPPLLQNDSGVVRTGDIVGIPVLRNDIDPDSDSLVLVSVDATQAAALESSGAGVAWVEGRFVYFQGGNPGRTSILYTVEAGGTRASAEVSFEVKAAPDTTSNLNQAPAPPDLVIRAVRNGQVRLGISRFGSDADGDSVELVPEFTGLVGAADGNRVSVDSEDSQVVIFEAGPNSGPSDEFFYTVVDRYGESGSAKVTVMVIDDAGWPPQAHDDVFRGKPGRVLSIPAVANDSSPQDRRLEFAELPFFDLDGQPQAVPLNISDVVLLNQIDVETRGRVEVTVPTDGTTLTEHYRITDGINPSDAFIRVTPDINAPNLVPVATPDVVTLEELTGQTEVTVPVLANDFDPDDASAALSLTLPLNQTGTVTGSSITVPLGLESQVVLYRIADADGGEAIGQIRIPGLENHPPILSAVGLDPNRRVIQAATPAPLSISLDDIVEDPDGDPNIRLTPTEVVVLGGLGSVARDDDGNGFTFEPPAELQQSASIQIQFEVTDRPEKSVAERQLGTCHCLALLTVDVVIEASSPPRIISQGAVPVPQLDEQVVYDLAALVVDDQDDPLTYELDTSTFGGLEVTQNGSQITLISELAEDQKIPVGSTIPIRFTVADQTFEPVEGAVIVTMIRTNKGKPAPGSFPTLKAERDFEIATPNFVDAAFNPFPDRPLTLVSASVDGVATVSCGDSGDCVFFSNGVGSFTVTYTLKDAVDQTTTGTLDVVVEGKPLAPGVPSIESVGDHVVNLTWSAANDQGSDIFKYHVTAVGTGITKEFLNTGGAFDGLINGEVYRFTVTAENELGMGEVSNPSSPAIPDRVPDAPINAAFMDYQDGTLALQWAPPPTAGDFTPIITYEVSIGGQVLQVDGSTTSVIVGSGGAGSALQNGTDYTFRVRAQNSAITNNGWGDWSSQSLSERPSRYPDQPTGVVATHTGDGGQPRLTVTWNPPPFNGGRPVGSYRVCMVQQPTNCQDISSGTQATFDLPRNTASSFTVIAYNSDKNRNNSNPSAASAVVTTVGTPDAPVISAVSSGDHTLTATASTTNNSGCPAYTIQYRRDGGAWTASSTFNGLTNGQQYSIDARTVLGSGCGTTGVSYISATSNVVAQTPYGPLVTPTVNVSRSGTRITWTWSTNRADDGRPSWSADMSGACNSASVNAGTFSFDYGYGPTTYTCTLTVSASGVASKSASASATTPSPPSPTPVSFGAIVRSYFTETLGYRGAQIQNPQWTTAGSTSWTCTLYVNGSVDGLIDNIGCVPGGTFTNHSSDPLIANSNNTYRLRVCNNQGACAERSQTFYVDWY